MSLIVDEHKIVVIAEVIKLNAVEVQSNMTIGWALGIYIFFMRRCRN